MDNKSILIDQPPKFEWRVYRNDTTILTIAMMDSEGNPIDLTGWTFGSIVREFPDSTTTLTTASITVNDNFLTMSLDTSKLERISYFDIQALNAITNQTKTILNGVIYVEEDVTR